MNLKSKETISPSVSAQQPDLLAVIANAVQDRLFLLQVEPEACFRFICINDAFLKGSGFTREHVIGKRIDEIIPLPFHAFIQGKLQDVIDSKATAIWTEHAVLLPETYEGEVAVTPITDPAGYVVQLAGVIRDVNWRRNEEEEGRELTCHLIQLQDEERRRIGRELHDSTAQELAAAGMNIGLVLQRIEGGDATNDSLLSDSLAIIEQCNRDIRTLAYLLHPPLLEDAGLSAAAHEYVSGFSQRSGINVTIDVSRDLGRLPTATEQALFRVLQESLGNVHRHSGSTTAAIQIWREDDKVILEIKDQGHGLPPGMISAEDGRISKVGVGIAGMRERLRQLGGRFTIESSAQGTTVRAMVQPQRDTL